MNDPIGGSKARLAATLAVLGPLLVVALFLWFLWDYADEEERLARENAGRVMNARVASELDTATLMERMLAQSEPRLIILGPSYANTDVNPALLARRLGLPRDKVLLLSVPNSTGAHWYAILRNRVYANGHRPDLVIVVSGLQSMLLTTPLTEASYVNLAVHLDGPDPVLEDKARTSTRLLWARLRQKRGMLREGVFAALRDVPAGWLFRSPDDEDAPLAPHEIRRALDGVFADEKVDMSLHQRGVVVADSSLEQHYDPSMLPTPERSLIPDITALVTEHGGQAIWVRPPMSPNIPAELDDVAPLGAQDEARALVNAAGGVYLDLRSVRMSGDMFRNVDHMNVEGSRRFTEALARTLRERGVMDLRPADRGDHRLAEGVRSDLLGVYARDGDDWVDESVRPTWPDPPPPVPRADRPAQSGPGEVAYFDTSRWEFLSDERLLGESRVGSRCSPLRITEDGVELPGANAPCVEVKRHGHGRSCHTPKRLYFTASDGTDPYTNGRDYRMILDAERRCEGMVWLYPGDRLQIAWPADSLTVLEEGADTLFIGARYLQRRPATLEVLLRVEGEVRLRTELGARQLSVAPALLNIEPPIPPGTTDVQLEVRNLDQTFYLLTDLALSKGPVAPPYRPGVHSTRSP